MSNFFRVAMEYKRLGLSVVPIGKKKQSLLCWQKYQHMIMPDDLLMRVFNYSSTKGIAIVCGCVSGHLEAIDFDCKNDLTNRLFIDFVYRLAASNSNLVARVVVASTKNKGFHIYYRCLEIERNSTLAKRPSTILEKAANPHQKLKVLIETRGVGGYIIVPPTDGYQFLQNDFRNLSIIEPEERRILLNVAKSFDQYASKSKTALLPIVAGDSRSPFDDFNRRGNVIDLLEKHGWTVVRRAKGKTFLRRPGDTDHETSGDFNHELGLFAVFSTSTVFEPGKGYKPYAVYAILECDGDFQLAAKRLLEEGYGIPYKCG